MDQQRDHYQEYDFGGVTGRFSVLTADDEEETSPAGTPAAPEDPLPESASQAEEELWEAAPFPPPEESPAQPEPIEPADEVLPFFRESPDPSPEAGKESPSDAETVEEEPDRPRRSASSRLERRQRPRRTPRREQPAREPEREPQPPDPPKEISVAEVVASTVDAVLEERKEDAQRYSRQRKKAQREQEKIHRSNSDRAADTEVFPQEEPSLVEATVVQKRRWLKLRKLSLIATALAVVCWIPAILAAFGVEIPYYHTMPLVRGIADGALLAAVCGVSWPVFAAGFGRGRVNCFTLVSIGAAVTLLDTLTSFSMDGRSGVASLSALSALALALAMWGEAWRSGALRESFRLVALGQPAYVVDLTQYGALKQAGQSKTYYSRTVKEDSSARWQALLLPVVLVGSLVFAVLASWGQGNPDNFLWSWSAILTAGGALALPFVYSMPFFRLARRLGKSGCALAGHYGAKQLSYSRELLVGDEDLFPPGTIRLAGIKIIGEEKRKVAGCAGSLALAYQCGWTPLLRTFMMNEAGRKERLEQFHVHEEGGVSATIRGETAILGTAQLLRKMSVRLPRSLERKDAIYLSLDGQLAAIFALEYQPADSVRWALSAMRRNGITPLFVTRDPNLTLKSIKNFFGTDGGGLMLELNERLTLSRLRDTGKDARPNALLYREGLAPCLEAVAGSKRLCQAVRWGGAITLMGSIAGTLLSFYLLSLNRAYMLSPAQLLLFLALWTLPVLLLSWNADRL